MRIVVKVREARVTRTSKPRHQADAGSLESAVGKFARSGKLANAAKGAIKAQTDRGLAVTFKQGKHIFKLHADGRREMLGDVLTPKYRLPLGVALINKK